MEASCVRSMAPHFAAALEAKDKLPREIDVLVSAYQTLQSKSPLGSLVNWGADLRNANAFISKVTDGNISTVADYQKQATPEIRALVERAVDSYTETLANLGADFEDTKIGINVMEELPRMYNVWKRYNKLAKSDEYVHATTSGSWLFKGAFELFSDRHRILEHHPVVAEAYGAYQRLGESLKNARQGILRELTKRTDAFDSEGLPRDAITAYLPFMDSQFTNGESRARQAFRDNTHLWQKYVDAIEKRYGKMDIPESAILDQFVHTLRRYQREVWNPLNYGVAEPDASYRPEDHPESIAGHITQSLAMLRGILTQRQTLAGEQLTEIEKKYLALSDPTPDSPNRFHLRMGYVPQGSPTDDSAFDPIFGAMKVGEVRFGEIAAFLRNREGSDPGVMPFDETLTQNLIGFGFGISTVARYAMAKTIEGVIEKDHAWVAQNQTWGDAAGYFSRSILSNMESYEAKNSAWGQAARDLSTAMTSTVGLILTLPNSALANYAGGHLGYLSHFGADFYRDRVAYKGALKGESVDEITQKAALAVQRVVRDQFLSAGEMQEFIARERATETQARNIGLKATKAVRDAFVSMADTATSRGILALGGFQLTPDFLTFRGSETRLREDTGASLFERAMVDIRAMKSLTGRDPDEREIVAIVDRHTNTAFLDMNKALGDFSKENRPFWLQIADGKYRDNIPMILAGTTLQMYYAFKQVALQNLNLIARAGVDMASPGAWKDGKMAGRMGQSGFMLGLLMLFYDLAMKDIFRKGPLSRMPIINPIISANPIQEIETLAKFGALKATQAFMPMTNGWVSPEHANEIAEDAMRLAMPVFAGRLTLDQAWDSQTNDAVPGYEVFNHLLEKSKNVLSLPSALQRFTQSMGADEYYDARMEIKRGLEAPLALYSLDHLRVASRLVPILFAHGSTPAEDGKVDAAARRDLQSLVASCFGLQLSRRPETNLTYGRMELLRNTTDWLERQDDFNRPYSGSRLAHYSIQRYSSGRRLRGIL